MADSFAGSRPRRCPRARASAMLAIWMPSAKLLHTWPVTRQRSDGVEDPGNPSTHELARSMARLSGMAVACDESVVPGGAHACVVSCYAEVSKYISFMFCALQPVRAPAI